MIIKIPTTKKINGKNQSANVLNLKGGLRRIKSPYLSVKNIYISLLVFPSFILFLIKIRKSLARGAFDSSIDWFWQIIHLIFFEIFRARNSCF